MMTAFNFRSLLLAAIVLSNCITWTASRHHYAHNVHQHRTRHRRQGAGLYLPASYVIPGGEGQGPWGEWGEVSPCSRTCGGGVASQKRICLQPGPEGQPLCTGGDTKYFSCQTQDCPDGSGDFRAEQCAAFNDIAFRGFKYNWVPYTKAPNPCELNCMPHGERFYFRHKLQVTDGTRCNDESFDVCVNGQCQPVGCDMMLNSTAREDKCRECRGNGANCRTTEGIFDSQDLMKGYNDILLIPAGSTSIYIGEVEPSNNYLALRAKNGTYYLNGHYHIDFPRTIMIAGAPWTYERSQQGYAAPDRLRCLGPTNEPLYLSLLLQDENVGIRYEYSVPNNSAPPTDKRYNWVHEEFTPCSATCGGGFQTRNVSCRSREELEIVEDSLCDEGLKPPTNQSCSTDPCPPQWVEGQWGECSQRCGAGGVKSREVTCQKIIANGATSIVPDKECFDLLGPKPEAFQKCNEDAPCPTWFVGQWKPCDKLCDEGKQTRNVVCYQKIDGRIEVLDDKNCTETKPDVDQPCMLQPCDGVDWLTSSWSGCDSCTSKIRTRVVVCSTKARQMLNDSFCSYHTRPTEQEECKKIELPPCEVQWYATQWSKCSVNCGEGVQTRKVFCGTYYNSEEGEGVEVVDDAQCSKIPKYNDTKPCTVPKSECPSQWFAGPWTECTKECGGGERYRRVMCFRGDKDASDCDGNVVIESSEPCNTGPCNSDDLLPVSQTSTVVMDDEEYCDDEDYPEAGLDVDTTSTTNDITLSDSPGFAEHESTLESGSGFGSSLSTDSTTDTTDSDYTTDDEETGSGYTSTSDVPSSTELKGTESTTTTLRVTTKSINGIDSTVSSASTESTVTGETTPSDSTVTGETSPSGSTITGETSSSGSTITGETTPSGSTVTGETTPSGSTITGETTPSESTITAETTPSGTTITGETSPSGSTITRETTPSRSTITEETTPSGSTITGETTPSGSTITEETTPSGTTITGETTPSGTTITGETTPSGTTITGETSPSGSTITGETTPSGSTITGETSSSGSTITGETTPSGSTVTGETTPSGSTITGETTPSESTITAETTPSGTTITGETSPSGSTITRETTPSRSTITEETTPSGSTITGETTPSGSTITEETTPSGTTITGETTPSGTTITGETTPSGTTITGETSPSGSTITGETTPSGSTITGETTPSGTTITGETTPSGTTITGETSPSGSTITGETSSSASTITGETTPSGTTITGETSPSGSTITGETTPSGSTITGETTPSGTTITGETSPSGSTITGETTPSGSTITEETTPSGSTITGETTPSGSTITGETTPSGTTITGETTPSGTTITGETSPSGSTSTGETSSSASTITGETTPSGSTITGETTPSGSTITGETSSSGSTITGETTPSGSTITGETSSSGSTITGETTPSGTTITGETTPSGSTITDETTPSGSTITEETTPSGTTITGETTPSGTTITGETTPSSTTITGETTPSGSTITEETTSSGSTITDTTGTGTSESESTNTGSTDSEDTTSTGTGNTDISSTGSTDTTTTTRAVPTDSTTTTFAVPTGSTTTTLAVTTASKPSSTEESTTELSTGSSETAKSSTDSSESTAESSTSSGTDSTSTSEKAESSTIESSTVSGSSETTEASSTVTAVTTSVSETGSSGSESTGVETSTPAGSESTTETVESSSLSSISTGAETSTSSESESTAETTESGSSTASESTTKEDGSSTEVSTSVSGEITTGTAESTEESTTESGTSTGSTGSDESTISSFSTTEGTTIEGSTGESESTATELSTTEGTTDTTPWPSIFVSPGGKPVCKPRRKPKCNKSKFGCCPDKKTTASGPFDEGCPKPRICKESTYKCCPDGLSPAQGENNEGCPVEPCADTLFGCCTSDNTTAAQGNDQEGCPPPPPPCTLSEFRCCADNETEATGPNQEGCPENETSTTEAPTETTTSDVISTTESTETSEGSTTTSEGTTGFLSSTTLDPCSGFEFGCCADNETEASGPNGEGCPCNATEFGCCPDGVSPALGLENEGCQGDCRTSPHGCCEDNKTPAHGPDSEGCCLLHAFGCCPDNRKPAEGPHLEGCGCQDALHGCCPDNVTIAEGPDNQGCGCQYTQHGCCPDRHTAASGPNNEGCACNTFQFGCCPDGVTNAGPDQQGCHCRDSTYGCCGDGETPATGPNGAGCDCSSSQYGCCPDGHTEATGPKFLGCTDAPENKQAACSMSTDPGPCHNFTAMWYYDMAYGGCSRFWYGGCDGNGNRFATKEECEDVCVQPSPKDACKLPSVKGACDADYQRWHYNSTREQCIPFRYGGCLGNANNFDTRELCQKQCEPSSVSGQCELPIDQGTCAGNYSRWGFNSEAYRCEQFIWGGCEGNSNRFSSEAACQMRCAGTQPPLCTQPQEAGNCAEKEALWSFSQSENRCLPFYYTGCGGNENRFRSKETCEETCPSAYVPDKCTLPAATGECSNYREKWFYDTAYKRCRQFYYGGCGGNQNNFDSEAECENSCSEIKTTTTTTTTTTTRPTEPQPGPGPRPETQKPEPKPPAPDRSEFCFNPIDAGPCNVIETRYAYNSSLGRCVTFQYGGCGGNQNNFPDEAYCTYYCQPIQDICQLPMLQGPCEDSLMRWFYDPTTDSCSQFTYGGCEGNDNRFETLEACENRCRTGPAPVPPTTTTPATTVILDEPSECRVPESLEDCRLSGVVWYFDPSRHECVSHSNQDAGTVCRHTGTFLSQEACERSCGAFRGVDVCKQPKDPGPCQAYTPKVYFDQSTGQCHEFIYGGCLGGANRFSSIEECSQHCQAEIADVCTLPPEEGNCFLYVPQWYFDPSRDECNQFIYTGCSGNGNRFESQRDCEARCKAPAPVTTTSTPAQQLSESECKTPSSLAPCGNNVTVFYYDSEKRQCLISGIGGCGHPNSYGTEEECERTCGAFRGQDVCTARLDPGPCRASFPKIYWDAISGSCQEYAYGGCQGGPNRFSNVEECMRVCGATGPARECLQEVDTGHSCAAAPTPRWHYSVAHVDCVVFAYLGCGGNDNNFRSYEHCAGVCRVSRTRGDDSNEVLPQDCTPYSQECEAIVCPYGVDRFAQDGCQRCQCREDPCVRANCAPNQRCVAFAMRDPATQEAVYNTRCVTETNDIYDCEEYVANCSRLRCEYGIQRTRLPDGCEKCSCIQVEIDCEPLREECNQIKCNYGIERVIGTDGCERCKCKENPCARKSTCGDGERCVVQKYVNYIEPEPKFTAECRPIVKAGACPMDSTTTNEVSCRRECQDDADCRGVGKCCRRGCSDLCLVPVEQTSPHPPLTTTIAPNLPGPPQALPQPEPQVTASEGGAATLRCLFHGNPPPKITWRFGELTIDGNDGRYRLTSDGALEIVSLYRNDTGVYICVADNGLGVATQEIHLVVNDPVRMPVGIAGDENAVVTGELGKPLHVRCLAYGYPPPSVFWYRGYEGVMVPYNDAVYEARGNVLLIRSLAIETLGQYTCQAYNGEGKAASWVVYVRAYMPEGFFLEHEFLVPRDTVTSRPYQTRPPTTAEATTTTTTTTTTEAPRPLFTVPVSTHITSPFATLNIGADLRLTCDVDGFPEPDVHWTKDGAIVQTDGNRITITGSTIVSRLTVARVTIADSGLYACHASNPYSSQSDTTQINVQQFVVPAKCTDNPFFANCDLIVRSNFCRHKYYSKFCCKSCVEAGQLDPQEAELQADQPLKKK